MTLFYPGEKIQRVKGDDCSGVRMEEIYTVLTCMPNRVTLREFPDVELGWDPFYFQRVSHLETERNDMAERLKLGVKYVPTGQLTCALWDPGTSAYIIYDHLRSDGLSGTFRVFNKHDVQTGICSGHWMLNELQKYHKEGRMSQVSKLAQKLLDADTRTLMEAGYLNSELALTSKGEEALKQLLFVTNKVELIKQAKADLTEEKKNCKE